MTFRLSADVGGSLTDVLLHESERQRVWLAKTPSTPRDEDVPLLDACPAMVLRDLVSAEASLRDYGAVIDGDTGDEAATFAEGAERRRVRGPFQPFDFGSDPSSVPA